MAKQVLPIAGAVIGAFFGMPQIGFLVGSLVAGAIPDEQAAPSLGDLPVQRSEEGSPRAIIYGTAQCTGYIIDFGPPIETTEYVEAEGGKGSSSTPTATAYRNYAIAICEGPIGGLLRVWENDKLKYDVREDSLMLPESFKWMSNKNLFLGTEDQPPSVFLELNVSGVGTTPTYAGTAYLVFGLENLTDSRGAIPQYRFEVANAVDRFIGPITSGPILDDRPCLMVDGEDVLAITAMDGGSYSTVDIGKLYTVTTYQGLYTPTGTVSIDIAVDAPYGDPRIWPIAISPGGYLLSKDENAGVCKLYLNGLLQCYYKPYIGAPTNWWYIETPATFSSLAWFVGGQLILGLRQNTAGIQFNRICFFPLSNNVGTADPAGADAILPINTISSIDTGTTIWFVMHVSRQSEIRTINTDGLMKCYDSAGTYLRTEALPALIAGFFPGFQAIDGFGIDTTLDMMVVVRGATIYVFQFSTLALLRTFTGTNNPGGQDTRVVFTSSYAYVQARTFLYVIEMQPAYQGRRVVLGDIVEDLHDRSGIDISDVDVTELTDELLGVSLQGNYDAAAAIDSFRSTQFFDRSEPGDRIYYPKRGKPVVMTLNADDLVEIPDLSKREQVSELPRKLHLTYQNATAGYSPLKEDSEIRTKDFSSTDEATAQTTVVMTSDEAAQTVQKMHRVMAADAQGEIKLSIPEQFMRLVPSDCIGLNLRGQLRRLRIDECDMADRKLEITARIDRQSAYTSNLTGLPVREPTLPPSTIVGETELAVLDIASRADNEDDLHYLVAGSGALPGWYGWTLQRSLDGGASYTTVEQFQGAALMGALVSPVPLASEFYTDTTNKVVVALYRSGQSLDSITLQQFLSEGGAFALEKPDGSYEVMQYLDADLDIDGNFVLSTLHRGQLNSGPSVHNVDAKFVLLRYAQHIPAQSAWIGQPLTNRAVSFEESPETGDVETITYAGRSQLEWPVAYLKLTRDSSNIVTGTWTPRHRFGTEDAPVASINFQGYTVSIIGTSTISFGTTSPSFSYDASGLGSSVTVSVAALNRITGPGPATSGVI